MAIPNANPNAGSSINALSDIEPVRLHAGGVYCSGTLISADLGAHANCSTDLVLTCAHFFRERRDTGYHATSQGYSQRDRRWSRRVIAVRTIDGTDIAIARLSRPVTAATPALSPMPDRVAPAIRTIGFGGHSRIANTRIGRLLFTLPIAFSKTFATRIRHAGIAFNSPKAIKGDSGGPVMSAGAVVGTQALVFDPLGINLGFATIALTAPHHAAIAAACRALNNL